MQLNEKGGGTRYSALRAMIPSPIRHMITQADTPIISLRRFDGSIPPGHPNFSYKLMRTKSMLVHTRFLAWQIAASAKGAARCRHGRPRSIFGQAKTLNLNGFCAPLCPPSAVLAHSSGHKTSRFLTKYLKLYCLGLRIWAARIRKILRRWESKPLSDLRPSALGFCPFASGPC